MNHARLSDNEEPEIVVIAKKEVVITTNEKQNNAKTKEHASKSTQKMNNVANDSCHIILTTHGVVDLGD